MGILIKEDRDKNLFYFLFFIFLSITSCSTLKNKPFNIFFNSGYEMDYCTLIINGTTYLDSVLISTDRSIGVDLTKRLIVKEKEIDLNISFYSITDKNLNFTRKVSLDTVLYLKNGYNIIISAKSNEVRIKQENSLFY